MARRIREPGKIRSAFRHVKFRLTAKEGSANYSLRGGVMIFLMLALLAAFSFFPLLMAVNMALKPINELFFYPPNIFPVKPTLENFSSLFSLMSTTWVPFSRYIFNTFFVTIAITVVHVLLAAMAAYPLSKNRFRGKRILNTIILYSLMFVATVTDVANYITISRLGWMDTYAAVIIPALGAPLGLFVMRNYMSTIPDTLLEAARMDGCDDFRIFRSIVMPIAKPAWITVGILIFQQIWSQPSSAYIYREELKTLPYALSQIVNSGIARMGAAQAVGVMMLIVPAIVFIVGQSKIIGTMVSSGIKE